jgi:hypothetical protein
VIVTSPTPVAGGLFFQALAFSGWHGCGLAVTTGATYCWGNGARNGSGQGFTSYVPIPVARP